MKIVLVALDGEVKRARDILAGRYPQATIENISRKEFESKAAVSRLAALRARLAMTFREYQNAQQMAERYEKQIVPRAQQAYDLYLTRFRQMAVR